MGRRSVVALLGAFAVLTLSCTKSTDNGEVFRSDLSGAEEVPVRPVAAIGNASFQVDEDGTVSYTLLITGLDAITAAHIHTAAAGVNGPIRVDLSGAQTASGPDRSILVSGTFSPTAGVRPGFSYDQVLAEMRSGGAYVNAHTAQFPGGAIRGQVRLVN